MGNCQSDQILHTAHSPVLGRLGAVSDLRIVNSVWLKDYQGLFDYESKQIRKHSYFIKNDSVFYVNEDFKQVKETTKNIRGEEMYKNAIFQIVKRSNYYKIVPVYIENETETIHKVLWLIVRSVPGQKYALKEKDIIKLGKQRIKVREIVHKDHHSESADFNSIHTAKSIYEDLKYKQNEVMPATSKEDAVAHEVLSIATENQQICRICLQSGQVTNPLICPCKCLGSVRYIHLKCLRTWLGKRLNFIKSKNFITIKWTPLTCEMCKTHYKYRIYLDNKKYYTVQIPKPGKPYIVLEVMKKNTQYSKILHFVTLHETSKVSLGRKKDIDIKISDDISVSRHHANLIYDFENRQFLLEDNKSKFGTLVQIKRNLLVNPFQRGISLQTGGQVYTFQTYRNEGSIQDYYDQQSYLNVMERGDKVQDSESEENNDEEYEEDVREEENEENVVNNGVGETHVNPSAGVLNVISSNSLSHVNNNVEGANNQLPIRSEIVIADIEH